MELSNTRIVPAPPAAVWSALNDPAVLKECLPGCESFEQSGENAFAVVIAARVGPVAARFNGRMTMTDIEPPSAYTLHFEGQGGAAGFARGEAHVRLASEGEVQTAMSYTARAQVGGKLAQIGSRLVDGAAAKMTDDFFARFVARVAGPEAAAAAPAPAATPLAPPGGSPWIRYAAIAIIIIVLVVLYLRGSR
ncbi:MAG TPA: carbon monoxide dehydrogenase subunit G [Casimicrobiaceae bacterium]